MDKEKTAKKVYKAALIIIGNEILSGRTQDTNLAFIARELNDHGIRLAEVRVVPDEEGEIIHAVNKLRSKFDYVFTTGGIGPTHDDITSECIAKAFGTVVHRDPDAVKMLEAYYQKGNITDARLKMADVPKGCALILNPISGAPGFRMENVYVMAGVPKIMQAMLLTFINDLEGGAVVYSKTVEGAFGESALAPRLTQIQKDFPDLDIGSYPSMKDGQYWTSIVIRGIDIEQLNNARNAVIKGMEDINVQPSWVD